MGKIEEGCGCVYGAFPALMVVGGLIFALCNDSKGKASDSDSAPVSIHTAPTYTPPHTYSVPTYNSPSPRQSSSSFSPDDAYDEGYSIGYEHGEYDGRYGYGNGHSYDDSNDYYNKYEDEYLDGYNSGYDDGYNSGHSHYEDEEDND
ncbi:MAG: hypothetical protein NC453_06685 [Muribaculum sp.]|nr:hypothetical protein [Muribaculum sp.]